MQLLHLLLIFSVFSSHVVLIRALPYGTHVYAVKLHEVLTSNRTEYNLRRLRPNSSPESPGRRAFDILNRMTKIGSVSVDIGGTADTNDGSEEGVFHEFQSIHPNALSLLTLTDKSAELLGGSSEVEYIEVVDTAYGGIAAEMKSIPVTRLRNHDKDTVTMFKDTVSTIPLDSSYYKKVRISAGKQRRLQRNWNLLSMRNWGLDRLDQYSFPLDNSFSPGDIIDSSNTDIYIIDTGINPNHDEFRIRPGRENLDYDNLVNPEFRVAFGYNAISTEGEDPDNYIDRCNGHGTAVAAQAAGYTTGTSPDSVVVPVKVIDCDGRFSIADVLKGLDWSVARALRNPHRISVINLSGRAFGFNTAFDDAAASVAAAGIPFVVATGNEASPACNFSPNTRRQPDPAQFTISVGSTRHIGGDRSDSDGSLDSSSNDIIIYTYANGNPNVSSIPAKAARNVLRPGNALFSNEEYDEYANYSNYGRCADIAAPGTMVFTASYLCSNCYTYWTGTSFSCPLISGLAALIRTFYPQWSAQCVRSALVSLAVPNMIYFPSEFNREGTPNRMASFPVTSIDDIPLVCDEQGIPLYPVSPTTGLIGYQQVWSYDPQQDPTEGNNDPNNPEPIPTDFTWQEWLEWLNKPKEAPIDGGEPDNEWGVPPPSVWEDHDWDDPNAPLPDGVIIPGTPREEMGEPEATIVYEGVTYYYQGYYDDEYEGFAYMDDEGVIAYFEITKNNNNNNRPSPTPSSSPKASSTPSPSSRPRNSSNINNKDSRTILERVSDYMRDIWNRWI